MKTPILAAPCPSSNDILGMPSGRAILAAGLTRNWQW
jgi:hypothetical protein